MEQTKIQTNLFIRLMMLLALSFSLGFNGYPSNVDTSFNPQIQTSVDLGKRIDRLISLPDGKFLAVGNFNHYNGLPTGNLIRINSDGSLDSSYANNLLVSGLPNIFLQDDGTLIMIGNVTFPGGVVFQSDTIIRLTSDGVIDNAFTMAFTGTVYHSILDASGRIVLSGNLQIIINGTSVSKALVRLNTDGTIDESFDHVYDPTLGHIDGVIGAQGNKVLYTIFDLGAQQERIFRLNEDGTYDTSYSPTLIGSAPINEMAAQSDNKLLVRTNARIIRLAENGGYDVGFQTINFSNYPYKINLLDDGRITIAHSSYSPSPYGTKFLRYLSNGSPDPTFTPYFQLGDPVAGHAVASNGSILIGDIGGGGSINRFKKLNSDGSVDQTFNVGGVGFQTIKPGTVRDVQVLPDGKIIMAGDFDRVNNISRRKIALLRVDSSLDTSFQLNTDQSGNYFSLINDIYKISVQNDGKILLSGNFQYFINGVLKANIVRVNSDGSIDASFALEPQIQDLFPATPTQGQNKPAQMPDGSIVVGTSGMRTTSPVSIPVLVTASGSNAPNFNPAMFTEGTSVAIYDLVPQNDGKILVSGRIINSTINSTIRKGFVARLTPDGSIDPSFQIYEIADRDIFAISLLLNGQIMIVSRSNENSSLFRLNANGTQDASFNTGDGANGKINSISVLPNSTIVVGGLFSLYNGQPRQNLALISADGMLLENLGIINQEIVCTSVDGNNRVLIGGQFTSISSGGQQANISYLARLNTSATVVANDLPEFDYDGDGKSDISLFRPETGTWYLQLSQAGFVERQFGISQDLIAPADYDGDGKTDIAVFRPENGVWYVVESGTSTVSYHQFGVVGDLPVPADYDGDSKADVAIYRPSTGTWWLQRSEEGLTAMQFGILGDVPVPGDFDGDGRADIVVYRPSNGVWHQRRSTGWDLAVQFGTLTDKIVPSDYDGDGKIDIAFYRPSTGTWNIVNSSNGTRPVIVFGTQTDTPTPGDFDGDGKADLAVFRPASGQWWMSKTTSGLDVVQFGSNGDKPTQTAYLNY